jgi:hypothetical protein
VLGKPFPLCSHPQQCFAFMGILRLAGNTATFLGALSVMVSSRHSRKVVMTSNFKLGQRIRTKEYHRRKKDYALRMAFCKDLKAGLFKMKHSEI